MPKLIFSITLIFLLTLSPLGGSLAYADDLQGPELEEPELVLYAIFEPYPTYLLELEGEKVLIDYLGFLYSYPSGIFVPIWAYDECFNHALRNDIDLRSCDPSVEYASEVGELTYTPVLLNGTEQAPEVEALIPESVDSNESHLYSRSLTEVAFVTLLRMYWQQSYIAR